MRQDREISVNWLRVNVPQVVAVVLGCSGVIWYVAGLEKTVDKIDTAQGGRTVLVDKTFEAVQKRLDMLENIPLRMDLVERGLQSTNQRVDQYLTTLGAKIDSATSQINSVNTKVEVLNNKVDLLLPEKRADAPMSYKR